MADQKQEFFDDIFHYAMQGVDSFKRKNSDFGENPYEQILEELNKPTELNLAGSQPTEDRRDVVYHFASLPALSENILGKHGLRLKENCLKDELEYLSDSYQNRDSMNHEELSQTLLTAEGIAKIFKDLNEL